ncbi:MAG: hypothetical protein QM774_02235 [Gordonia sp. (in: high G+C Gram-positive bacteria)]|uniref:hypothetical protein n=1 Tax=Gordonia sp. (in: high G+C Gram-positive bacteria) TaxID=84139 RepID=UPI0039E58906
MFKRKKRPEVRTGDITVDDLRSLVKELPAAQPITDEYEARTADLRRGFSGRQKEHLLGWLDEYNTSGAYGRKNPSTSGKAFYNHFRCEPGLLWLAEALGEDAGVLRAAVRRVEENGPNPSSECGAFRRDVPWARIVELIERRVVAAG